MKKTKKAYEQHLNASYANAYSLGEALENFSYLSSKKGLKTTSNRIQTAHNNHTLGSLLRKLDPIAFNTGFNDWKR